MHTQCKLQLPDGATQVAWIPSEAAVVGYEVELKADDHFWRVIEVWSELADEAVKENERNFKNHRKATDI